MRVRSCVARLSQPRLQSIGIADLGWDNRATIGEPSNEELIKLSSIGRICIPRTDGRN